MVDFLRAGISEDGVELNATLFSEGIGNFETQQSIIFDKSQNGFCGAFGETLASHNDFYHFFNDFSKEPELSYNSEILEDYLYELSHILNEVNYDTAVRIEMIKELINRYPEKDLLYGNLALLYHSFDSVDEAYEAITTALEINENSCEYRLIHFASLVEMGDFEVAIGLNEQFDIYNYSPFQKLQILFYAMHVAKAMNDTDMVDGLEAEIGQLLVEYNVENEFGYILVE